MPTSAARWTRKDQFHLTIRFLGNIDESRVPTMISALRDRCSAFSPLNLRALGMGFFPEVRRPRVVYVGVRDSSGELPRLWQVVQAATENFTAEASEKQFSGHVTLARLGRLQPREISALKEQVNRQANSLYGEWIARELELLQSQLSPHGARHTVVAAIPFNPA